MTTSRVWGIHMRDIDSSLPIEQSFVAIGWPQMGDLTLIPKKRDAFKKHFASCYPAIKPGAIPVQAGVLYRFIHEIKAGDIVVFPSKADRIVNIGVVQGDYQFRSDNDEVYPNSRRVEWKFHVPRDRFSQAALYEIGSALTLFSVKNHVHEFIHYVDKSEVTIESAPVSSDDENVTVDVVSRAAETTEDFVVNRLKNNLTPIEFEHFVAHLLDCMGYHTRVTPASGDGGVDVIAHRDELGFEPPIIKVQCKQITDTSGEPEVNQLLGTLGEGEFALFVNLGAFSKPAKSKERNNAKLRLIDGDQLVKLVLENYQKLAPRYRTLLPLKQIYVADV